MIVLERKVSNLLLMDMILVGKLAIGNEEFGPKTSAAAGCIERD